MVASIADHEPLFWPCLDHWPKHQPMSKWRILYIAEAVRSLGTNDAPTAALAREEAIEFYDIETSQHFRVVAVKIEEAKKAKVKS